MRSGVLEQSVAWDSHRGISRVALGKALWIAGRNDQAQAIWGSLPDSPRSPLVGLFEGLTYEKAGEYDLAIRIWQNSQIPSIYFLSLARWERAYGSASSAIKFLHYAESLGSPPSIRAQIAGEYDFFKQYDQEQYIYQQMLSELSADSPDYWWAKGEILRLNNKWEEANSAYAEGQKLSPLDVRFFRERSVVLVAAHNWAEAIPFIENWQQLSPKELWPYLLLGETYFSMQDFARARQTYEMAKQVFPNEPGLEYHFGVNALYQGNADMAISYLRKAIEEKPDYADAHFALAQSYYKQGELSIAIDEMKLAVSQYQVCSWQGYASLGYWYLESDMKEEYPYLISTSSRV